MTKHVLMKLANKYLDDARLEFLVTIDEFIISKATVITTNFINDLKSKSEAVNELPQELNQSTEYEEAHLNIKEIIKRAVKLESSKSEFNYDILINDLNASYGLSEQDKGYAENPKLLEMKSFATAMVELRQAFIKADSALTETEDDVAHLSRRADLLRSVAQHWTIYQSIWENQLYQEQLAPPEFITVGNTIVHSLYKGLESKNLKLKVADQVLKVVPFMSRLYASGFDMPMPYVVTPLWAYKQTWSWVGYTHEVGHHVYRNVRGFSQELKANLILTLANQGVNYDIQRIWFHWIEEIFADLFGVLQIGKTYIDSQQKIMPFYLPKHVIAAVGKQNGKEGLFRAADEEHPIPYIRVKLTILALESLLKNDDDLMSSELKELSARWETFFEDLEANVKEVVIFPSMKKMNRKSVIKDIQEEEIYIQDLMSIGDIVLDMLLNTPFYSLANSDDPLKPRTIPDVFSGLQKLTSDKLEKASNKIKEKGSAILVIDEFDSSATNDFGIVHLVIAASSTSASTADTPIVDEVVSA